jgi:CHAT domain-containing protein
VDRTSLGDSLNFQEHSFPPNEFLRSLLQRFEKDYPNYYNMKYQVKTMSAQKVQEQILDDNTALVEYFTGQDSIFIFAITRDEFDVVTVAKASLFEQQVRQLRSSMIDSLQVDRKDVAERCFARYTQSADRLYQSLLEPVADKISGKKLIIVPDGVLNAIPVEALLTKAVSAEGDLKKYSELPYLLKEHAVSYA